MRVPWIKNYWKNIKNLEALVDSAEYNIKLLEDNDFFNFKISVKSSDIFLTVKAYRKLSEICNYPLHLRSPKREVYLLEV